MSGTITNRPVGASTVASDFAQPGRVLRYKIPATHNPTWIHILPYLDPKQGWVRRTLSTGQVTYTLPKTQAVNHDDDNNEDQNRSNKKRKVEDEAPTIPQIRELFRETRDMTSLKIEPNFRFNNLRAYTVKYPGPRYNLLLLSCNGRVVVKGYQTDGKNIMTDNIVQYPKIGSIIVAANGYVIP